MGNVRYKPKMVKIHCIELMDIGELGDYTGYNISIKSCIIYEI